MATPKKDIPPKKTKEAKKPSTKSPPPKKTQQTKKPTTAKAKTPEKKKPSSAKKSTNINKITSNGNARESDVEAVPSPSSESRRGAEQNGGKFTKTPTPKSKKGTEKGKRKREGEVADEEEVKAYTFPMERVRRIIRSEDSDLRISNDAVFLINKATEKFLEKFCEESHACCVKDRRKAIAYKHLATVVSKRKRYDFLSDYVPEKVKAEDALAKRQLAEAKAG
ncbi:unnamed protein product [Malus baccata var. baccata]